MRRLRCWWSGHALLVRGDRVIRNMTIPFDKNDFRRTSTVPWARTIHFECERCGEAWMFRRWSFDRRAGALSYFFGRDWELP